MRLPSVEADQAWAGRLAFDRPRSERKAARLDWARINETPEWFTVRPGTSYAVVVDSKKPLRIDDAELIQGVTVRVSADKPHKIRVAPAP